MATSNWKLNRDPLFRGDSASGVSLPTPSASSSLVRHILYLEGYGRETPYLSGTENWEMADRFAGHGGHAYTGRPKEWSKLGVKHRSRKELLQLLRGTGQGDASWPSAFEIMRARQYVEEWQEHLADFRELNNLAEDELRDIVDKTYSR